MTAQKPKQNLTFALMNELIDILHREGLTLVVKDGDGTLH